MSKFFRAAAVLAFCIPILNAQTPSTAEPTALTTVKPPAAAIKPATDSYFGTTITDPYRWMEKGPEDPEFMQFLKEQNDYTR
jgi:prolyl oligopeptidase